jgi:hypothetical protein
LDSTMDKRASSPQRTCLTVDVFTAELGEFQPD